MVLLVMGLPRSVFAQPGAVQRKESRVLEAEIAGRFRVLDQDCSRLLYEVLLRSAAEQFDRRRTVIATARQNDASVREYQASVRRRLADIIASFPERSPLNAKTTRTIEGQDYRIENVVFESVPNLHVTGNLYIPKSSSGPFPAVLVASGHSVNGKAEAKYQSAAILLAKHGFVALAIDTFAQGERREPSHTQIDIGAMLAGTDLVAYQAWDNIRAIDYLCSRPEVDPKRLGVTGNSGGGTQSMYLLAFDPRIQVAAPSCGLQTREQMFAHNGLADGCHNFAGEGLKMLEYADYFIQSAPKPVLVLAGETDPLFRIDAVSRTVREAKWFCEELGALERIDLFSVDEGHGFARELREAAVWWFQKWLKNEISVVKEPALKIQSDAALAVTKTGQVLSEFKGARSITDVSIERAEGFAPQRARFWAENPKPVALAKVKALINYADDPRGSTVKCQEVGEVVENGMRLRKLQLTGRDDFPLPVLLYIPEGAKAPLPTTLYIDGRGKQHAFNSEATRRSLPTDGRMVLAVDLRGFGETTVNLGELRKSFHAANNQHQIAQTALYIGRPLMGQRVQDAIDAIDYLFSRANLDKSDIEVVGVGDCGPVALHVAAIDSRVTKAGIVRSISSWMDIIREPTARNQFKHVVPDAMKYYDLPDLVAAISPRTVSIIEPVDAHGRLR